MDANEKIVHDLPVNRPEPAVMTKEHTFWSEPTHDFNRRVSISFIAATWLYAFVSAFALAAIGIAIVELYFTKITIQPFTGLAVIVAGSSTLLAFIFVLRARLTDLREMRWFHSLMIGAFHLALMTILWIVSANTSVDWSSYAAQLPLNIGEPVSTVFVALQKGAFAALVASLLVPGVLTAGGDLPITHPYISLDDEERL